MCKFWEQAHVSGTKLVWDFQNRWKTSNETWKVTFEVFRHCEWNCKQKRKRFCLHFHSQWRGFWLTNSNNTELETFSIARVLYALTHPPSFQIRFALSKKNIKWAASKRKTPRKSGGKRKRKKNNWRKRNYYARKWRLVIGKSFHFFPSEVWIMDPDHSGSCYGYACSGYWKDPWKQSLNFPPWIVAVSMHHGTHYYGINERTWLFLSSANSSWAFVPPKWSWKQISLKFP